MLESCDKFCLKLVIAGNLCCDKELVYFEKLCWKLVYGGNLFLVISGVMTMIWKLVLADHDSRDKSMKL